MGAGRSIKAGDDMGGLLLTNGLLIINIVALSA
jgi:hypothetical protein